MLRICQLLVAAAQMKNIQTKTQKDSGRQTRKTKTQDMEQNTEDEKQTTQVTKN